MRQYDLVVIGAGPGGYVAAIRAAQLGASVAVVEKDKLGGTCLNRGCIPTKTLAHVAEAINSIRSINEFGVDVGSYSVDFEKMINKKNQIVKRLSNGISFLIKKHKIDLFEGEGTVVGPNLVEVRCQDEKQQIPTKNIIIATGSKPIVPPAFNYDGKNVITSDEALNLKEQPKSLLIVGAGVVGCEFANIFSILGSKVYMVDTAPSILPSESKTISQKVERIFANRGIEIRKSTLIKEIKVCENKVVAYTEDGDTIVAEKALISIGRKASSENLGLSEIGVELDQKGGIVVNDRMQTNVSGIYAIGDVTNKSQLAHVAMAQGKVAAENIMGKDVVMDYGVIPSCIFVTPEVSSVGLDLDEAIAKGYGACKGSFSYRNNGKQRQREKKKVL